ncbi:hypothetical protein SESBI_27034 [Sesbania bispinosa]|nr:hypothetical protein SESBI_27034 [Sesbania bispinosa]
MRGSKEVLQKARSQLSPPLSDFLVCPLSKQPLRYCEESNSLISDAIGVKNGIPCLVPRDGKILEEEGASKPDNDTNFPAVNEESPGRSA